MVLIGNNQDRYDRNSLRLPVHFGLYGRFDRSPAGHQWQSDPGHGYAPINFNHLQERRLLRYDGARILQSARYTHGTYGSQGFVSTDVTSL